MRITDQSDLGVIFEMLQQEMCDEGFAGTNLAGKQHKAAALFDGIDQIGEGFVVPGGFVKEAPGRAYCERGAAEGCNVRDTWLCPA